MNLVSELCGIIDLQNRIIQAQAEALAQLDAEVMADEIAEAGRRKEELLNEH